jgi:hypothetical protein
METTSAPTYTILGGDGQQYGPITADQFRDWARDGRVNGQTQVLPAGAVAWCAASSLPELGTPAAATPALISPQPTPFAPAANDPELDHRIRSGASWFYWIAALTLISSVCWFAKVNFSFALGMGVTRHIDYQMDFSPVMALVLDALICGLIALLGFFAIKRQSWAFIAGLIILVLDTVLSVQQEAWFSVAFHVWAIVSIFMAFRASRAARV